jgi:hypothetical protein
VSGGLLFLITGAPLWVWPVLAYLLFIGVRATRDRVLSLPRLFLTPLILVLLRIPFLLEVDFNGWVVFGCFLLVGVGVGFSVGFRTPVQILYDARALKIPGSLAPLILLILFFCIKYTLGALTALHPNLTTELQVLDLALSAVITGYFTGVGVAFLMKWMRGLS